jgi:ferredoxin
MREGDSVIRVEFESAERHVVTTGEAEPFARLIDVCDESRAPVEFSCRSGTCGTCRIEVLEGEDLLREPSSDEEETLMAFDAPPTHRLACRARFRVAEGLLRVRSAGDDP